MSSAVSLSWRSPNMTISDVQVVTLIAKVAKKMMNPCFRVGNRCTRFLSAQVRLEMQRVRVVPGEAALRKKRLEPRVGSVRIPLWVHGQEHQMDVVRSVRPV